MGVRGGLVISYRLSAIWGEGGNVQCSMFKGGDRNYGGLVPGEGVEPSWPFGQRILSPLVVQYRLIQYRCCVS